MLTANGSKTKTLTNVLPLCLGVCMLSLQCLAGDMQLQDSPSESLKTLQKDSTKPALQSDSASDKRESSTAEDPQLRSNHPESYTVQKGDTLWSIAHRFLTKPWLWPQIWHVNTEIANPNLIYPGDTIKLSVVNGKTKLTVTRGEAGKTVKLSPAPASRRGGAATKLEPAVRIEPLAPPIPTIPLEEISPFLVGDRILKPGAMNAAPYLVGGASSRITAGMGDVFWVRGTPDKKLATYQIYRKGKTYIDDKTGEILGEQAIDIGTAKILDTEKNMTRVSIVRSTREVLPGDKLFAADEHPIDATFHPSAPKNEIKAQIIDVVGGVNELGPMSAVLINQGKNAKLEVGNILAILQKGSRARDPVTGEWIDLPDDRSGLLMIFNVFDKTSYGLVLLADRALSVGDKLQNP